MYYNHKVTKIINDELIKIGIKENDILVVALSGGPDSMCLIDNLYRLKDKYKFILKAIHVNHGIRGDEALRDENFVRDYCKNHNIDIHISKIDAILYAKENKLSIEESARKLRYNEIEKFYNDCIKDSITYILTAHHKNDQVETILNNMCRGTGIKGLVGMKKKNNYLLRPMISIEKNDIDDYLKNNNIISVFDSTNDDVNYTRNFIRKEIMPLLLRVNEKAFNHIYELSNEINELDDFVTKFCDKMYEKVLVENKKNEIILNLNLFNDLNPIIKVGVIKKIFSSLVLTLKDITRKNINDIINIALKDKGGHIDLPYNLTLDKKKKYLIFRKNIEIMSVKNKKRR